MIVRVIGVRVFGVLQGGFVVGGRLLVSSLLWLLFMVPLFVFGVWVLTSWSVLVGVICVGLSVVMFAILVCWLGDERIWLLYAPWRSPRYSEVWLVEEVGGKYYVELSGGRRVRVLSGDDTYIRARVAAERRERILAHFEAARQRAAQR